MSHTKTLEPKIVPYVPWTATGVAAMCRSRGKRHPERTSLYHATNTFVHSDWAQFSGNVQLWPRSLLSWLGSRATNTSPVNANARIELATFREESVDNLTLECRKPARTTRPLGSRESPHAVVETQATNTNRS
ncbi:hypothetical protein D8S78_16170 [Natrialba swarupiae]|nr:hypothetical protein [Natrialba swarupiae]